jgi:hypothetical protein
MGLKIMAVGAARVLSFLDCSLARGEKKAAGFRAYGPRQAENVSRWFKDCKDRRNWSLKYPSFSYGTLLKYSQQCSYCDGYRLCVIIFISHTGRFRYCHCSRP